MNKVNRKKVSTTSILAGLLWIKTTARVKINWWSKTMSKMTMKNSRTEKLSKMTNRMVPMWARNQLPPNKWWVLVMANQVSRTRKKIRMAWCTKMTWRTTNFKIMKDKTWIRRLLGITMPSKMTSLSTGPLLYKMWAPQCLILMKLANNIKKQISQ